MKIALIIIAALTAVAFLPVEASPSRPPWSAVVTVVNESNRPIAGAKVEISYYIPPPSGHGEASASIYGVTDTNGVFRASHDDTGSVGLGFRVTKPQYYTSTVGRTLYEPGQLNEKTVNASRHPELTLVLKRIGNPIPLFAKREEAKLQMDDEAMGFDLTVGDWIAPYGKGSNADIFLASHREIFSRRQYNATLTVTFPNRGDGIVVASSEPETGSEFRTSRTASEIGYQPKLELLYSNTNEPQSVFGYFIRVRTVLDENGNVKSALYGKIAGNFRFYAGTAAPHAGTGFDYYLNPTTNDRNVEFDPKQNLFKHLSADEQVTAP